MRKPNWDLIDTSLVRRSCTAELEDNIGEVLRREHKAQTPSNLRIPRASSETQQLLAANIKHLCIRAKEGKEAREYLVSRQSMLHEPPFNDKAPSV